MHKVIRQNIYLTISQVCSLLYDKIEHTDLEQDNFEIILSNDDNYISIIYNDDNKTFKMLFSEKNENVANDENISVEFKDVYSLLRDIYSKNGLKLMMIPMEHMNYNLN